MSAVNVLDIYQYDTVKYVSIREEIAILLESTKNTQVSLYE